MSKLSDVVKNDVVKKAVYDKLVAKVDNFDTSDLVLKAKYQTHKTVLKKKSLMQPILLKLTELENKIPDVSSLAAKKQNCINCGVKKMPSVSSLLKKIRL